MSKVTGYLGTYQSPESTGIYQFQFDTETGIFSEPSLYYEAPDSKYLSLEDGFLASPLKHGDKAGICLFDTQKPKTEQPFPGALYEEKVSACYVLQDSHNIYTANYHEGSIIIYEKSPNGIHLVRRIETGLKSGCHQLLFYENEGGGKYLMAICLLLDTIIFYDMERDFAIDGTLTLPKGTGPRHGIFDKKKERFFLVSELSNELFIYRAGKGLDFELMSVQSVLPEGGCYEKPPTTAAVRLSPDEDFLYLSTRYADVLTVYRVSGNTAVKIQQIACEGRHPRDFILTEDGRFLIVVNRFDGGMVSFPVDRDTGRLESPVCRVHAPEAVAVVLSKALLKGEKS